MRQRLRRRSAHKKTGGMKKEGGEPSSGKPGRRYIDRHPPVRSINLNGKVETSRPGDDAGPAADACLPRRPRACRVADHPRRAPGVEKKRAPTLGVAGDA